MVDVEDSLEDGQIPTPNKGPSEDKAILKTTMGTTI